jgi:hypothetical protein
VILASILITSPEHQNQNLPVKVLENIASFKSAHPDIEHRLFTGPLIRDFLSEHFGADVLFAYDSLKPYAYKADLARYCLLYHFGGVYADISCYFLKSWLPQTDPSDQGRIAVFMGGVYAPWEVTSSIFSAPARHKALAKAIDLVCANVRDRNHGSTALCPTGPVLFGKAIALTCEVGEITLGRAILVAPSSQLARRISEATIGFVFGDRMIAVKRKKGGAPQSELGVSGGNEYVKLWRARDVYAEI